MRNDVSWGLKEFGFLYSLFHVHDDFDICWKKTQKKSNNMVYTGASNKMEN